ncbi:MAG: methyltransferase domain-containing protein [Desulfobulbaceae bacterium]|nr:methyltransferase domain-containing protein [Desulfobulbaceae bacterium]
MQEIEEQIHSPKELKLLYKKEYVDDFLKNQSPVRLERLIQYVEVENDFCVADFGCGNGMLMPLLAPKVASYVGIDFSEEFIKETNAAKKIQEICNAEFICSEIKKFCNGYADFFDCAFAMDFSEHVPDDQLLEYLLSIKISLKRGAKLYLHTPNSQFFDEIMKEKSFLLKQLPGHIAVRSAEKITQSLIQAGYSINKILFLPHYNILKAIHILFHIPIIGKYFKARMFIVAEK